MSHYINGLAKSGNHALAKACTLLGVPMDIHHIPYADKPIGRCLMIVRHPKNIMCSWLRVTRIHATPLSLQRAIPQGIGQRSLIGCADAFGPWLTDADTAVIRYEDLMASKAGLEMVAAWLEVPCLDVFEQLPGGTGTWTGDPSDWQRCWDNATEAVWRQHGGLELEVAYGY